MTDQERLRKELASCPGRPFSGNCFRVVELEAYRKSKTPTLLFDLGPKIAKGGQRFSPPSDHRGLYISSELETAGAEFADGLHAWKKGDCPDHVAFKIKVKLASVLDLTDSSIRRKIKMSKARITSAWQGYSDLNGGNWPVTWALGHEAFASGRFDGIIFPSTKLAEGTCLLVFTERLSAAKSHVIIFNHDGSVGERLP